MIKFKNPSRINIKKITSKHNIVKYGKKNKDKDKILKFDRRGKKDTLLSKEQ